MKIAVFGTGEVGSAVADKLKALGHDVVFGSRHPGDEKGGIPLLDHHAAAAHAEIAVNAMHGEDALDIFRRCRWKESSKCLLENDSSASGPNHALQLHRRFLTGLSSWQSIRHAKPVVE